MAAKGAVQALEMALQARGETDGALLHHSDPAVQYCSWRYVDLLRNNHIAVSMTKAETQMEMPWLNPFSEPSRKILPSGASFLFCGKRRYS
ncbi:hypothetical protein [Siphonobacter aquaeclarae]|uniref:hypothetical protein n=1 Tax=Siphonobacter aquaeclarae TaxID=563176 RepID=UPI000B8656DF|nr:hypothetical protein [Siphonobacter aquaeclarae]